MLTRRQLRAHLRVAERAARAVGPLLRRWAGRPLRVATKRSPIDLVTEVDRRAERLLFRHLHRAYPAYGFVGEELPAVRGSAPYQWCVDPIDGTTNFIHGVPMFCISIALVRQGRPIAGVIFDPVHEECFTAARGLGSYLNRRRIRVSRTRRLAQCLLATGFPTEFRRAPRRFTRPFIAFQLTTHAVRRIGSAALNFAYVACGRLDGVWEQRIWPWDVAAAMVLLEEAGGRMTSFTGRRLTLQDTSVLATNRRIHRAALKVLRRALR